MKRIIVPALLLSNVLLSKNFTPENKLLTQDSLDKNKEEKINKSLSLRFNSVDYASMYDIYRVENIYKSLQDERVKESLSLENDKIYTKKSLYEIAESLLKEAKHHLGKRYVWGAVGPSRFDCSGFTSYVCKKNGITIPRTSIMQAKVDKKISKKDLKAGDLIFFDTSKHHKGYVNHVGIYLGDNRFIHASSARKKVMISSLKKRFYNNRFKWGRRVAQEQTTEGIN